ncbi:glucose 1-dehydrogenase [Acinetobacter oleivorans]|uniref:SDR family NAD(P)-dependent oxidoreductase n=1 Tax=Acinetobacter oleivorans TaxID=1148157 RepID=UPI00119F83E8|nr:glucose 1-dehydrogenase [Acinetobacter oleivorans]NUF30876.1 glucose 1-dehydrogenase [Acinetobacter oleivorans]
MISHVQNVSGRLEGKVALVTGAGTGIGKATALSLAKEGAHVVLAGRTLAPLQQVSDEIESTYGVGKTLIVPTDINDSKQIQELINQIIQAFGRLDIAFNNAGIEGSFAPAHLMDEEDFDKTILTNLRGTWLAIKYQITAMMENKTPGVIINTSSWLAVGASSGSSAYSASKGALDSMIRALALEIAPFQIRINNVNPGIIDTPMFRRFVDDETAKPYIAYTPQQRLGQPADVANTVTWLCTNEASFITGQSILIDGGFSIAGLR